MTVTVLLPDGSRYSVPGQLVWRDDGRHARFEQVPINCDPLWLLIFEKGHWLAKPRFGPDIARLPGREEPCWWEGIWQMDESALPDDDVATPLSSAA